MDSSLPPGLYGTMARLWDATIRPLLEAAGVRSALEIGCDKGHLTRLLIDFCGARGGIAYGIDPEPQFDPLAWEEHHEKSFRFYQGKSLDLLPTLPTVDAVLIDGDHNYFTVLHELRALEKRATDRAAFPLTILHDVGWPYGRRDLYYHPEHIPSAVCHPHHCAGMSPGNTNLTAQGINAHLENADTEQGKENGVLTAMEDFLAETGQKFEVLILPGIHGLGILIPQQMVTNSPALASTLRQLKPTDALTRHLQSIEDDRIRLQEQLQQLERERSIFRDDVRNMELRLAVEEGRAQTLERKIESLQGMIARMNASRSWRWTAPLRRMGIPSSNEHH